MVNSVNAGGAQAAQLGKKPGADEAHKADAKASAKAEAKKSSSGVSELVKNDLGADGAAETARRVGSQVGKQPHAMANADPRKLMKLFDA